MSVDYSFTASAVSGLSLFSVTSEGVAFVNRGVATVLPWAEIASVQLAYVPSRFDVARYRCDVGGRSGKRITFFSTTYEGPGNFVAKAGEYVAVVNALHQGLRARGSSVRYGSGVAGARWLLNAFMVLLMVPVFWLVALMGTASVGVPALAHLLTLFVLLPLSIRWLYRNRPQQYAPAAIPATLLPAVPAGWQAKPITRRYRAEDFGPIAEPGDSSWSSAAGNTTHWADAERYAEEANEKLDAGVIGPPKDPPPQGEQPR